MDGPDGQARTRKHGEFAQHGHPVPGKPTAPHQAREHGDDRQCRLDKREGRELLRHREPRSPTFWEAICLQFFPELYRMLCHILTITLRWRCIAL